MGWIIAQVDLVGTPIAFYEGHKDTDGDNFPVWCLERERAYAFQTERFARQIAEQFQDYASARSYGYRYAVELVA